MIFIFFYLVKINKLIFFFNLDAVAFFNVKKKIIINLGHMDINLVLFIQVVFHVSFFHFWSNDKDQNKKHFSG